MENSKHLPTSVKDMVVNDIHMMNLDFSNLNQSMAMVNKELNARKQATKDDIEFRSENIDLITHGQVMDLMRGMLVAKMITIGYPFYYHADSDIEVIKSILTQCKLNVPPDIGVHFVKPQNVEQFVEDHGSTIHLIK